VAGDYDPVLGFFQASSIDIPRIQIISMPGVLPSATGRFHVDEVSFTADGNGVTRFTVSFLQFYLGLPGDWVRGCVHYSR